jgi:tRNA1(Val) A37 N6-methylase TrmN6
VNSVEDSFWDGELVVWQPARGEGYRFNIDSVLLADFLGAGDHVVDLGAGCGFISLLLLAGAKFSRATAVEALGDMCELIRRNALANGVEESLQVVEGLCQEVELPSADAVVFNPPYFRASSGRPAKTEARDVARHERLGGLQEFLVAAHRVVGAKGRVGAIVPAERRHEFERISHGLGFGISRQRPVVSRVGKAPRHFLLEAKSGPDAEEVLEPLVVHGAVGREYSEEVRDILKR